MYNLDCVYEKSAARFPYAHAVKHDIRIESRLTFRFNIPSFNVYLDISKWKDP